MNALRAAALSLLAAVSASAQRSALPPLRAAVADAVGLSGLHAVTVARFLNGPALPASALGVHLQAAAELDRNRLASGIPATAGEAREALASLQDRLGEDDGADFARNLANNLVSLRAVVAALPEERREKGALQAIDAASRLAERRRERAMESARRVYGDVLGLR